MFRLGILQIVFIFIFLMPISAAVYFANMGDPKAAERILEPIMTWTFLIGMGPWIVYYVGKFLKGFFSVGKAVSDIRSENTIDKGTLRRKDDLSNTDFAFEVLKKVIQKSELRGLDLDFSDLLEAKQKGTQSFSVGVHTEIFDLYEKISGDRFAVAFSMPLKKKGACVVETLWHPDGYDDALDCYMSGSIEELAEWLFEEILEWNEEIKDKVDAELSETEQLAMLSGLKIP